MDADLNRYDLYHITTDHPRMSRAEWAKAYDTAWRNYYTAEHVETILRRAVATGASGGNTLFLVTWFKGCTHIEHVHPLEGGFLRLKFRRDRRPTLPMEPVWSFYPKYWCETVAKQVRWVWMYFELRMIYLRVKRDPARREYTDLALTPVTDDEIATRELFRNETAQAFVSQQRRLESFRHRRDPSESPLIPAPGKVAPDLQAEEAPHTADAPAPSVQ